MKTMRSKYQIIDHYTYEQSNDTKINEDPKYLYNLKTNNDGIIDQYGNDIILKLNNIDNLRFVKTTEQLFLKLS
jgi:hypothetical protein